MALRGKSYVEILKHYYKGVSITSLFKGKVDVEELLGASEQEDLRIGDRCFEFFNCYAVTRCPVYARGIALVSEKTEAGFRFRQRTSPKVNLETLGIKCEFLRFREDEAIPLEE